MVIRLGGGEFTEDGAFDLERRDGQCRFLNAVAQYASDVLSHLERHVLPVIQDAASPIEKLVDSFVEEARDRLLAEHEGQDFYLGVNGSVVRVTVGSPSVLSAQSVLAQARSSVATDYLYESILSRRPSSSRTDLWRNFAVLRDALADWGKQYNLDDPWCIEAALRTAFFWHWADGPPSRPPTWHLGRLNRAPLIPRGGSAEFCFTFSHPLLREVIDDRGWEPTEETWHTFQRRISRQVERGDSGSGVKTALRKALLQYRRDIEAVVLRSGFHRKTAQKRESLHARDCYRRVNISHFWRTKMSHSALWSEA